MLQIKSRRRAREYSVIDSGSGRNLVSSNLACFEIHAFYFGNSETCRVMSRREHQARYPRSCESRSGNYNRLAVTTERSSISLARRIEGVKEHACLDLWVMPDLCCVTDNHIDRSFVRYFDSNCVSICYTSISHFLAEFSFFFPLFSLSLSLSLYRDFTGIEGTRARSSIR